MEIEKLIQNPIRSRIMQYLLINKKGTAISINEKLSDIPKTTLYRHLKILDDSGLINVISEKRVRGTLEKTYELNQIEYNTDDMNHTINYLLLKLISDFDRYFNSKKNDMKSDMLSVSSTVLLLDDNDFENYLKEVSEITKKYLQIDNKKQSKYRTLTMIVSPTLDVEESK